jgi:beta-galactosidase
MMIRLRMRGIVTVAVAGILASAGIAQGKSGDHHTRPETTRSVLQLDKGWFLYKLPDFQLWPARPKLNASQIAQLKLPDPGRGWQPVDLPDDYVVRGTFSQEPYGSILANGAVCERGVSECQPPRGDLQPNKKAKRSAYGGHGYLPLYPAWYRRSVSIPEAARGKALWLDFGGVYRDAIVFVNGKFIAQHAGGYEGFRLDISSAVTYGQSNVIAVFVDPRWFEGWWYEGGGIYRHVSLIETNPLQVSPWGTFVNAQVPGDIHHGAAHEDSASAKLTIQTSVRNDHPTRSEFTLVSRVIDTSGKTVASASTNEELGPGQEQTFSQTADIPDAHLWSLERRNLYKLITAIRSGTRVVDGESTTFGVRKIKFDPDKGFFLNDQHVEIRGMCVHQDFPGVGIAAADNLWAWRIQKLKEMGTNGLRTAHGPESESFYDDADRMGMLVMAENRHLGDTYLPKSDDSTPYSDLSDLKTMILQQRNHPSIIMWSMSNEEAEGGKPQGVRIFAAMKDLVRKLDPSRPVTAAVVQNVNNKESFIPLEDILGINYHSRELAKIHQEFPDLMIYGSEDVNAKTSRGTLESSQATGLCSEYACTDSLDSGPWDSWAPVVENSFVAGQFVWTGFDYRGEPNLFSWPAVTSQTGIMDITGAPKPVYYYWKTEWDEKSSVYIFPEWNLPEDEIGKDILVRAFSNCERVELLLNGKSLGVQEMPRDRYLDWHVPYAPGKLTAVAYKQGREVARYAVQTAGAPAMLRLTAEVHRLAANGKDVAPIRVAVLDAQGRVVPDADNLIHFSLSGDGTLAGVANGNPASHEPDKANQRQAFHGLAMVLVQSTDHPGAITIQAQADGLPAAHIVVPTVQTAPELLSGR